MLTPRESAKFVADHAEHVKIRQNGIVEMAKWINGQITAEPYFWRKNWHHQLRPAVLDEQAVMFLVVCDAFNFCFWPDADGGDFGVTVGGEKYYRSWGMVACIKRAVDEGVPILNPKWQQNATLKELDSVFRSDSIDSSIPLLHERRIGLNELGSFIINELDGDVCNLLRYANKSAVAVCNTMMRMASWNDTTHYRGQKLQIMKRAQLIIADLWACANASHRETEFTKLCDFHDIDQLTAFADYRVPQTLLEANALEYSAELIEQLKAKTPIPAHDPREVEIRAVSLHAIELLVAEINKSAEIKINAVIVDNLIWEYAMKTFFQRDDELPHHRTRTIFY